MARFLVVRVYCVILMHALFVCVHCEFPTSNKNYSKKTNTHAISQPRHVTDSSSFSLLFRMERIWIGLFCLRIYIIPGFNARTFWSIYCIHTIPFLPFSLSTGFSAKKIKLCDLHYSCGINIIIITLCIPLC